VADITPLGNGGYLVTEGTRSRVAYAAGPADARWVFLDGRVYVIELEGSPEGLPHTSQEQPSTVGQVSVGQPFRAAKKKRSDDHGALAAPMPATVLSINVEPGQRVSRGDVLITLEAMKMELPIKAPRDASVKAIRCRPGELVQPGVPLLELE
jgi:biotin carboxyl carrier protein